MGCSRLCMRFEQGLGDIGYGVYNPVPYAGSTAAPLCQACSRATPYEVTLYLVPLALCPYPASEGRNVTAAQRPPPPPASPSLSALQVAWLLVQRMAG